MKFRQERVADLLQVEIANLLLKELKDPRIGFVSISRVRMTPDLKMARIYVSVLGSEKEVKSSLIGLDRAKGWIRREIGRRLHLRYTPELHFHQDDSIEYAAHFEEIIQKIHEEEKT